MTTALARRNEWMRQLKRLQERDRWHEPDEPEMLFNNQCAGVEYMQGKIYFFGTSNGEAIKIGWTTGSLAKRKQQILQGQLSSVNLVLLAAVNGTRTHELELKRYFSALQNDYNSKETFKPDQSLIEYIHWIRQQWWSSLSEDHELDDVPAWPEWMPNPERRVGFEKEDPATNGLFPVHRSYEGPLAGTPWDIFTTPRQKIGDDFYTPTEIVLAAKEAMGGIDLDAASHWLANREHKIKEYYHLHRSAFHNPWFGRVWLNPPYGDNKPWFEQIVKYWDTKELKQLCMISPVWSFATQMAKPIMARTSCMILLVPTPQFWGHPKGNTGSNHPHAVIYMGPRVHEFKKAFGGFGIPFQLSADDPMWTKPFDKPELLVSV